jgi:hypothetical protein
VHPVWRRLEAARAPRWTAAALASFLSMGRERGVGEELAAMKRNGKTALGGGPHRGVVGGGAVLVNANAEERPRSPVT